MTESDRERIIELMIDRPLELTDADIKSIKTDSELREMYEISRRLRPEAEIPTDIDAEWQLFEAKLVESRRTKFNWRRVAAIIVIALAVSATAAILIAPDIFIPSASIEDQIVMGQVSELPDDEPTAAPTESVIPEALPTEQVVFENISLAEIMSRVGKIYNCEVVIDDKVNTSVRLYFVIETGQALDETVKMLDAFEAFDVSVTNGTIFVK